MDKRNHGLNLPDSSFENNNKQYFSILSDNWLKLFQLFVTKPMDDKSKVLDKNLKVIGKPSDILKILKSSSRKEFNDNSVALKLIKTQPGKDITFRYISTTSKLYEKSSDIQNQKSKVSVNTTTTANCHNEMLRDERMKSLEKRANMIPMCNKANVSSSKCGDLDYSDLSSSSSRSLRQATGNMYEWTSMKPPQGSMKYIAAAALSGALALGIDVYVKRNWRMQEYGVENSPKLPTPTPESKEAFLNANKSHLMHSAILMATPFVSKRPLIPFTLITSGIVGYSGCNYYMTFYEKDQQIMEAAWIGGVLLMLGWLSLTL